VLAGTRISHPDDPRRRYQNLYRNAARTLELQATEDRSAENVIVLPRRQKFLRKVGWSLAASVLLVQAAIIGT